MSLSKEFFLVEISGDSLVSNDYSPFGMAN